jgi:hypothetical protein
VCREAWHWGTQMYGGLSSDLTFPSLLSWARWMSMEGLDRISGAINTCGRKVQGGGGTGDL